MLELWFALPQEIRGALIVFMIGAIGSMGAMLKGWVNYHTGLNERNAERADYFTKRLPELEKEIDALEKGFQAEREKTAKLQQQIIQLETANALLRQEISQLREKVDYYKGIEIERDKLRRQLDSKTARVNEQNVELSSLQQRLIDCEQMLSDKQNNGSKDDGSTKQVNP